MIGVPAGMAVALGGIFALWLGLAGWALFGGLRMRAHARSAAVQADRLKRLLDSSPALPMMVRADGRVEAPERLADWFGLRHMPAFIRDFAEDRAGLGAEDAADLLRDVATAQRSARGFVRAVRTQGSARTLLIRGAAAGQGLAAPGSVILWFFDATESQVEIAQLRREATEMERAFEAVSILIDAAPIAMWHRNSDLRLTLVNNAYVEAVEGESGSDVVARGLELIEAAADAGPMLTAARARDEGRPVVRDVPATIGGERRMMRIADVPLGDDGIAGYAIDIEEQEQARAEIRRFAAAQRDMLDRLSAGVAQFSPDRTLVFNNQPFQRLFAMRPEWIAEAPTFERVLERMREAGRLPEVRDFPGWKAERREWFRSTDGAIEENWLLPGGAHLRVVAHPLPDGSLLLIFEDRTEQVLLASSRDTLLRVQTATFDNLFEAIAVFAADGRLRSWNNKFRDVWGFDESLLAAHPRVDQLAAAAAYRLANPSRAGLIRELIRIATDERAQRSGRVGMADGRHFDFSAVPLPDGNALFIMLDISDSRRAEQALRDRNEALEAADRLRTAFMANMNHELHTPLAAIGDFAAALAGGEAGDLPAPAQQHVESILASVGRLGTLIDNILDLTQRQSGGLAVDRSPLALTPVAHAAAAGVAAVAEAKGIDLAVEIEPTLGLISGEERRIRQALDHLLHNAIAMTPQGGRILLHGDGTAKEARLIVSDDGSGMDAAQQARAFSRFHRAGDAIHDGRRAHDSLGIGLPLARDIVEAHDGSLTLISEPGEGTIATILLPR